MRGQLQTAAAAAPPGKALETVIDLYLTEAHRDRPDRGCVMAALGMEAPRAGGAMPEAYRKGIADLLGIYVGLIEAPTKRQQEDRAQARSEEHTSELQSLMRTSYAVFCLQKEKTQAHTLLLSNEL